MDIPEREKNAFRKIASSFPELFGGFWEVLNFQFGLVFATQTKVKAPIGFPIQFDKKNKKVYAAAKKGEFGNVAREEQALALAFRAALRALAC